MHLGLDQEALSLKNINISMLLQVGLIFIQILRIHLAKDVYQESESETLLSTVVQKRLATVTKPLKLFCSNDSQNASNNEFVWFYKSCLGSVCDSSEKMEGEKICNVLPGPACSSRLVLEKPKSGIYKCYRLEEKIGYVTSATLIKSYNLQIVEERMEPDIFEPPENTVAQLGESANFYCKIKSSLPLHVKWYKQVDKLKGSFQYKNKHYQLIDSSETTNIKNIFTSVLKLEKVSFNSKGYYACGAINEAGIKYKDAELSIEDFQNIEQKEPLENYWKFILIASAIIFLVITVKSVFCFQLKRKSDKTLNVNRRRGNNHQMIASDGNETSDYEHVISL